MSALTNDAVTNWIVGAAGAAVIYNQVRKAIRDLRGKAGEPPNEHLEIKRVEMERRITTAEALVTRIGEDRAKDLKEIEDERRRSASSLYQKVETTKSELTQKLEATKSELTRGQDESATEIYNKIERVETSLREQIVASDKLTAKGFQDMDRSIGRLEGAIKSQS